MAPVSEPAASGAGRPARPAPAAPPERALGEVHPPGSAAGPPARDDLVTTWPHLFFREVLVALLMVTVLSVISILINAPLENPADPTRTPNPAKAPWYFVGLQELLTYFDPWIAGVVIPALIVIGLCAIPYLDPNREGGGVYSMRERPLASRIFLAGTLGWFVLMVIGLWFRGPGWAWVWPWSPPPSGEISHVARSLPNWIGVPLVLAYFVAGARWIVRHTASWPRFTRVRRWTFAVLALAFAGTVLKVLLKLLFGLQYLVHFDRVGFNL